MNFKRTVFASALLFVFCCESPIPTATETKKNPQCSSPTYSGLWEMTGTTGSGKELSFRMQLKSDGTFAAKLPHYMWGEWLYLDHEGIWKTHGDTLNITVYWERGGSDHTEFEHRLYSNSACDQRLKVRWIDGYQLIELSMGEWGIFSKID